MFELLKETVERFSELPENYDKNSAFFTLMAICKNYIKSFEVTEQYQRDISFLSEETKEMMKILGITV